MGSSESAEEEQYSATLTPEEIEVLRYIFETILETVKAPTLNEMQSALIKPEDHIVRALRELENKDLLLRKRGTQEIVSIYPLSLIPTRHQISLEDGKKLFAMCAVDALGVPIMFSKDIKILSQCKKCKQKLTIEIINDEIVRMSHFDTVIWSPKRKPKRQKAHDAEDCCPLTNFFCCKEHLEKWTQDYPDLAGKISEIKQEFPRIKRRYEFYGKRLGFR